MDVADLKGCRGMARSKRTGQQCIRWAVVGTNVCDDYGGNAPQVIAAAKILASRRPSTVPRRTDEVRASLQSAAPPAVP